MANERKSIPKIVDSEVETVDPVAKIDVDHTPEAALRFLQKAINQVAKKGKPEDGNYGATKVRGIIRVYND